MNILMVLIYVVLIWAVVYLLTAAWTNFTARQRATVLKMAAFQKRVADASNVQLIDVREKEPFRRHHLKGARNMPALIFSQGKSGLRHDRDVYLYGDTLQAAARVAGRLRKEGLPKEHLFLMAGGYRRLQEANKRK
ncbi:rhodanese-like domain-containing protein [Leuconostocaceae bacterium ESL0958]|nr:rhodanese-like domain-containing protein [Leuconostocaceae bacterium ESL0958]